MTLNSRFHTKKEKKKKKVLFLDMVKFSKQYFFSKEN